ncbi:uncharacterized protein BDV17DRAFT_286988 [Aspergillus undulatus]|uniref:uncharacterized protein n=1 Tax=Aspergillus undulatus TaxID=1810928 RepID=UPI003CCD9B61
MALPTPPQSPAMTSTAPIPIPTRTATPIPTILCTSPPPDESMDYFGSFAGLTPLLPPPSPPSSSSPESESSTCTLSGPHTPLTPLTPLSDRNINANLRPVNAFLKPLDAGILSDSDISSLDLGPAHIRSETPSPSPSLVASLSPRPRVTLDGNSQEAQPLLPDGNQAVRKKLKRRDIAEKEWHARGQNKRRDEPRTDSSMSFDSLFSDSEGSSNLENVNLERTARDNETRAKSRKPVVAYAYAGVRRSPRRVWHR